MLHWVVLPLKRMIDYKGRSRRREFWLFTLAMLLFWIALYTLADSLFPFAEGEPLPTLSDSETEDPVALSAEATRFFNMIARPIMLFFAVVHLPLSIRRLHDTGRTWWAYLVIFLPYIGVLILLWLFIKDSEPYANKWGPDPKGRDRFAGFEDERSSVPLPAAQVRKS